MKLQGSAEQNAPHWLYRNDGSITAGGTAQIVLPRAISRSHLLLQNTSVGPLWFEIGSGQATAVLTTGVVTSVTINNAGFNYTRAPLVRFYGGGNNGNSLFTGLALPSAPTPGDSASLGVGAQATGIANLSGGAISSITITNGGSGYVIAPYVCITNSDIDPNGAAVPSSGVGILLVAGDKLEYNGTVCPLDPVAVWGATTGQTFVCRWTS